MARVVAGHEDGALAHLQATEPMALRSAAGKPRHEKAQGGTDRASAPVECWSSHVVSRRPRGHALALGAWARSPLWVVLGGYQVDDYCRDEHGDVHGEHRLTRPAGCCCWQQSARGRGARRAGRHVAGRCIS